MGRISRGWALAKESWEVLKRDRSLVVFPILSILSTIFAILAIVAVAQTLGGQPVSKPVYYISGVAAAYVSTFIAIFFNVALAACAVRSLRGEDTQVGEGLNAAVHRIGPILGWAVVATTVGLILRALEVLADRLGLVAGLVGRIAVWITEAAWAIATFFVIPVVAVEGSGPWRSLKRSAAIVKARWGEGATGAATIGIVTWVLAVVIALVGGFGGSLLAGIGARLLAGAVWAITIAGILVVSIISSALSQIFRVALYQYAVTGETPSGFDSRLMQIAFDGGDRPPYRVDPVTGRPL
jgi:hypothetical protein